MVHETEKSRLVNSLFNTNEKYASLMHANNNKLSQHELQKLSKLIHVRWFYSWKQESKSNYRPKKPRHWKLFVTAFATTREKKNNIVHISNIVCLFFYGFCHDKSMTNKFQFANRANFVEYVRKMLLAQENC